MQNFYFVRLQASKPHNNMKARFFVLATLLIMLYSCIGDVPQVLETTAYVINHTEDSIYVESSIYDYAEHKDCVFSGWCSPQDSLCVFDGITYSHGLDENTVYLRVYSTKQELLYEDIDQNQDINTWEYEKMSSLPLIGYFHFYGE